MSFQVYQAQGLRIYTGDTATISNYTGLAGEIAINTETKSVRILDGINAGGTPLTTADAEELTGLSLDQLADLALSSPNEGDTLVYKNGSWTNDRLVDATAAVDEMSKMIDVEMTNLQTGHVLAYNAASQKWVNQATATVDHNHDARYQIKGTYLTNTSNLGEVSDVQITMPANDQVLSYNASTSKWENVNLDNISLGGTVVAVKHAVVTGRKDIRQHNCYPYGLAITHTPAKATNKILLMAYIHHSTTHVSSFGFTRNGTSIGHQSSNNSNANNSIATNYWGQSVDNSYMLSTSYSYLDSPNSTSALTYNATACASWAGGVYTLRINDRGSDMLSRSSMVLMEIEP